jgi:Domain of unknown function (DUF4149)
VNGIISYRVLPRPQFSSLQQSLFPVYFSLQTALPALMALTYPGERVAVGLRNSGLSGVFARENRLGVLLPILTVFMAGLSNLVLVGPATTKIMRERKFQGKSAGFPARGGTPILIHRWIETRDGKKSYDSPPHSKEMVRLNKAFGRMHGISSLINLLGFLGTVWYGLTLAGNL